jgi:hypothetical protein
MTNYVRREWVLGFSALASATLLICLLKPSPTFAQDASPLSQVVVCTFNDRPEIFVMSENEDGVIEAIGRQATVTMDDKALTLIEGSTVYQFHGDQVTRLSGGSVTIGQCTDISVEITAIADGLEGTNSDNFRPLIPSRPIALSPPMTGSEREGFIRHVASCWNIDPSSGGARVQTSVLFKLNKNGDLDGDVELIATSGGDEKAEAEAMTSIERALRRCAPYAPKYLPIEKFDEWSVIEMTFDPSGIRMR